MDRSCTFVTVTLRDAPDPSNNYGYPSYQGKRRGARIRCPIDTPDFPLGPRWDNYQRVCHYHMVKNDPDPEDPEAQTVFVYRPKQRRPFLGLPYGFHNPTYSEMDRWQARLRRGKGGEGRRKTKGAWNAAIWNGVQRAVAGLVLVRWWRKVLCIRALVRRRVGKGVLAFALMPPDEDADTALEKRGGFLYLETARDWCRG